MSEDTKPPVEAAPEPAPEARPDQAPVEADAAAASEPTPTGTTMTGTSSSGVATVQPAPPLQSPSTRANASLGHAGIGVGAVGLACIAGGIVFAVRARSIEEDVLALPRWDPDLDADGERSERAAKNQFGVGRAARITGGVMMYLADQSELQELRLLERKLLIGGRGL
jgi:hypothetical protein